MRQVIDVERKQRREAAREEERSRRERFSRFRRGAQAMAGSKPVASRDRRLVGKKRIRARREASRAAQS